MGHAPRSSGIPCQANTSRCGPTGAGEAAAPGPRADAGRPSFAAGAAPFSSFACGGAVLASPAGNVPAALARSIGSAAQLLITLDQTDDEGI
ncbi:hypothetical protein FOA52_008688 [Chlamydomonas sp. UWO 241]|nr:hypothetical protein FOA52_008688 [Chlamydomonas sp. UWO 241]